MSTSKDELFLKLAIRLGARQSKDHANFIKKMENWVTQVFDEELTIEEKECVLHLIGLGDNKIDINKEVKLYKKKLSREISMQKVYSKFGQFQNLAESEDRCTFYIKEILRLISPRSLDIGAEFTEENTSDKEEKRVVM